MPSILQRFLPPPPQQLSLLDLPLEILGEIVKWLPIEDTACLALACKHLFFRYCSVHKAEDLREPRPLIGNKPLVRRNAGKQLPVAFLYRLENSRWKFCLECWKLHPRTKRRLPWEHHCYECYLLYGGQCVLDAGVVDLCPCLSITYRDMLRLIGSIKTLESSRQSSGEGYYEEALSPGGSNLIRKELVHHCEITDNPEARAEVTTKVFMDTGNNLIVLNKYLFNGFKSIACTSEVSHSSTCPHEDTGKWLQSFFKNVGGEFTGYRKCSRRHLKCRITHCMRKSDGKSFEVNVWRSLGTGEGSDKNWKHNRRRECPTWYKRLR